MNISFKIAWRNIQRHKGKSLVIGIILFLGAFIMTVGNGVISGMDKGLRENIMNRFTGHILIISKKQEMDNVLLTPMGKDVQVIGGYKDIRKVLEKQDYIDKFLPIGKGFTLILNEDGDADFAFLLGVNFEEYQKMFKNNVKLVEGKYISGDDKGILATEGNRKQMYENQGFWTIPTGYKLIEESLTPDAKENRKNLNIKDNIVLMGASEENTTLDIRLDIYGIVKYEFLDEYWKHFNITDIESFRETFHYVTADDASKEVSVKNKAVLENENLDSLFGDNMVSNSEISDVAYNVSSFIGKKVKKKSLDTDAGAYNIIFIKIKNPNKIDEYVKKLNEALTAAKTDGRAISWKKSVGQLSDLATLIRGALLGFVFFIFFVAIIIIMNTLSMAAMERINEIGMMRAVGAQKRFVGEMFFYESAFLSAIFGAIGITAGAITVFILANLGITTSNNILQLLFGGSIFKPLLDFADIMIGIIELAAVALIATLYPIIVARKITPLEAIARD